MKKLFLSVIIALMGIMTMSASTVYCKMTQSWWTADGAAVGVHYWGDLNGGSQWPGVRMSPVAGQDGMWSYDVPSDVAGLIFTRVNGGGAIGYWDAKTKDLELPTDGKNLYTITSASAVWGDPGCDGEWSVFDGEGGGDQGGGGSTPNAYWYYKGFIDGGNLENEEGGFNIFNCGTAHLDVSENAYIFVIFQQKGVQGVQYMAPAYVDGPTQATMTTTGNEKLHLGPGSYTLYLYKEGSDVILSTQPIAGKTLVSENCNSGTAIQNVTVTLDLNAPMFDVLGRKVNADYRGIIIQNGQKFIR